MVHGKLYGQTNHANADAVKAEVEDLLGAGARSGQIVVLTWSQGQKQLLMAKLRQVSRLKGVVDRPSEVRVDFVKDFEGRQADIVVADLVMADERTDHSDFIPSTKRGRTNPSQKRVDLMSFVRDPLVLRLGLTRARYGMIIVGQTTWLARWPNYKGVEDKHHYAALAVDAFRRGLHIRDTAHRDTQANSIRALAKLTSEQVSAQAQVADLKHHRLFQMLINAGPDLPKISRPDAPMGRVMQETTYQANQRRAQLERTAAALEAEEESWLRTHDLHGHKTKDGKSTQQVPENWEDEV